MTDSGKRWAFVVTVVLVAVIARACAVYGKSAGGESIELTVLRGIAAEKLLVPEHVAGLPGSLGSDFAVTDAGNLLLLSGTDIIEAEREGSVLTYHKLNTDSLGPMSFALDQSTVLAIRGVYLGQLDSGAVTKAVTLPVGGMRLAPSQRSGTAYIFGGTPATDRRVYLLQDDGSLTILAELPSPIVSVADNERSIFLATAYEIVRLHDDSARLVIRLPKTTAPIVSLAAAPDDETLYFATADMVYAVRGSAALAIVTSAGGTLRSKAGALYVLDPRRPLLAKLTNIRAALTSPH